MIRIFWWTIVTAIFLTPFALMYMYASNKCIPIEHTEGFCPRWIALGMFFPFMFWLCIAMIIACIFLVLNIINQCEAEY